PELSGYLFLADGTCYRIHNGLVDWLRDRNGNKITFHYDGNSRLSLITDSLNRTISITYSNHTDTITYTGFGGSSNSKSLIIHRVHLQNALRSGSVQTPHDLFPDLNGASADHGDPHNPFV